MKYTDLNELCRIRGEKLNDKWYLCGEIEGIDKDVVSVLRNADGDELLRVEGTSFKVELSAVKEWSPDKPYLYTLDITLYKDGNACDNYTASVGFRTIEWNPGRGMFLNGEKTRIKGICCYDDIASAGTLMEYRIKKLKNLGVNAYRCADHTPTKELLDICDRLGLLVMVDCCHDDSLEALIKLSRNHPSVFLYSLFSDEKDMCTANETKERILKLDSTRAFTATLNANILANVSEILDVIGISHSVSDYEDIHKRIPNKVILGTENAVTYATRGIYKTDKANNVWSSYGDEYADFSESLDVTMKAYFDHSFNAGCFVASGFDRRDQEGLMDSCGFEKDTAYHLAGYYKKELFAHIAPHWNHEDGKIRVCVFTNGHAVDVYTDEHLVASGKVINRCAEFDIPFEWGSIRARAYGNGTYADCKVWTAENFSHLTFDIFEGEDMRIIDVSAVDRKGHLIPDFCEKLDASGDIISTGNGNPNATGELTFFNGRAQIIARGKIKISCNDFKTNEI